MLIVALHCFSNSEVEMIKLLIGITLMATAANGHDCVSAPTVIKKAVLFREKMTRGEFYQKCRRGKQGKVYNPNNFRRAAIQAMNHPLANDDDIWTTASPGHRNKKAKSKQSRHYRFASGRGEMVIQPSTNLPIKVR